MSKTIGLRLKEERERLGFNQAELGSVGKVSRKTQFSYESDSSSPNADYLNYLYETGIDIGYVVTGIRNSGVLPTYTKEEADLINLWRKATADSKVMALHVFKKLLK